MSRADLSAPPSRATRRAWGAFFARTAALVGALAGTGCAGDGGTEPTATPQPGVLEVRLVTPNADDRALRATITGGAVTAVSAPSGGLMVHGAPGADGALVVAVGPLVTGVVARLDVPDVNRAAAYRATLVDVADTRYQLRPDGLPGYTVTVGRQGGS